MPSLSAEIERADPQARAAYETELQGVMASVAAGLPDGTQAEREARAWVLLSLLAGGVTLARAVPTEATALEIVAAVQTAVDLLAQPQKSSER